MKRKLINYDVFEKIKNESLSTAQVELEEASLLLARALEVEGLTLNSYGPNDVLFESLDGNYVHANYEIKNGYVQFDNVEQLVINEETERAKSKEVISQMLDSLIESNESKANELFSEWMGLPVTKRIFNEVKKMRVVPIRKRVGGVTKIVGYKKARWNVTPHHHETSSKTAKRMRSKVKNSKKMPASLKKFLAAKRARVKKTISEWNTISENVLGYVDLYENGPSLDKVQVLKDGENVVAVRVPTAKLRNEAKLLKFNWKTLNTDVVVKRNDSKKLAENVDFAKEVSEAKRFNALSDNKSLEESIERISSKFPQVLYLTESELARQIKLALESVKAENYDDETCRFLAEGLLRTAHESFVDRVSKIVKLAGAQLNEQATDKYAEFKGVVEDYYAKLDESTKLEMQAFVDVYEALRQVHEMAVEEENEVVAEETAGYLDELLPIIRKEVEPSLDVLAESAEWLYEIVEGTMDEEEMKAMAPVVSATGEHPDVDKKATHSQSPADCSGEEKDVSPASDGKDYGSAKGEELAHDGWSNLGGEGVYPSLNNPYVLDNAEYKIKGEKDIDSDSEQLAQWQSDDTWPNLENPYVKKGEEAGDVK